MWVNVSGLNVLNALFSTTIIVITAVVGLYYFRKANRAAQIEIVEDISKISAFREEQNEMLQARITQLGDELSYLKTQIAHLEGFKDYLLESKLAWRRYAECLEGDLRSRGAKLPPRPLET